VNFLEPEDPLEDLCFFEDAEGAGLASSLFSVTLQSSILALTGAYNWISLISSITA